MRQHAVYDWDDGSKICFYPSVKGIISQFALTSWKAVRIRLYWNPGTRMLSTMPDPALWINPPKLDEDDVRKLRGFILDAGFRHLKGPNLLAVGVNDKETKVYYPKWVKEERWGNRYKEAEQRIVIGRPPGPDEKWPKNPNEFLGHVENVLIFKDRFVSKTRGSLPFKIWWGAWQTSSENGSDLAASIQDAVDIITETRLLLPESAKLNWERANVNRGEFIVPSPEEVEVFRILEQELPFLLPSKELEEWIAGRGSA
jgi:hypothetical protein